MSIFDRLSSMLRPEDDYEGDDYYLDDDYEDDGFDDYEETAPKLSFFSRSKSADAPVSAPRTGFFSRRSDVLSVAPAAMQVTMKKPKNVQDFRDICDDLLDGKAVVINLEGVNSEIAQRVIDFTFGAVYSINGDLQEISKFIFMASPQSIELAGEFGGGLDIEGASRTALKASGGFGFN